MTPFGMHLSRWKWILLSRCFFLRPSIPTRPQFSAAFGGLWICHFTTTPTFNIYLSFFFFLFFESFLYPLANSEVHTAQAAKSLSVYSQIFRESWTFLRDGVSNSETVGRYKSGAPDAVNSVSPNRVWIDPCFMSCNNTNGFPIVCNLDLNRKMISSHTKHLQFNIRK